MYTQRFPILWIVPGRMRQFKQYGIEKGGGGGEREYENFFHDLWKLDNCCLYFYNQQHDLLSLIYSSLFLRLYFFSQAKKGSRFTSCILFLPISMGSHVHSLPRVRFYGQTKSRKRGDVCSHKWNKEGLDNRINHCPK